MNNTSEKRGEEHSPPPPRPAALNNAPPGLEKVKHRMGSARTLRRALMSAADEVGGDEGIKGYLKFLASSDQASDRAAFVGLLSKLLPRAVAVQAEVSGTGVNVVLPWLQEQRGVDATPADGVVIDQPTETINENEDA